MLNIDAARIETFEVSDELFKRRRSLEGVFLQQI